MVHDVDLRLVRAFVSIADLGGFSQAASALHITQPALSRRIGELEARLGLRLFDRTGRRARLTAEGEGLMERSRQLLGGAEALRDKAALLKGAERGVVRLGISPILAHRFLASFLEHYCPRWPNVELQLHEESSVRLLERVTRGDLDFAIASPIEAKLASRPLWPWHMVAVMLRTHPLARRKALQLGDIGDHPVLVFGESSVTRKLFDAACETAHVRPRIAMESTVPEALAAMARVGRGVAILRSNQLIDKRSLKTLPIFIGSRSIGHWTAINWDPRRFRPAYADRFVDEIEAFARRKRS